MISAKTGQLLLEINLAQEILTTHFALNSVTLNLTAENTRLGSSSRTPKEDCK